jgi:hypothetical protein
MSEKATAVPTVPGMAPPVGIDPVEQVLGGEGVRGEVAGCPTGLANSRPLQRPEPPTEGDQGPLGVEAAQQE